MYKLPASTFMAFAIFTASCAHFTNAGSEDAYEVYVSDDKSERSFHIRLEAKRDVCLSEASWPMDGQMHFAAEYVYVQIEDAKFPISDRNLGYCIECQLRVGANETIEAILPYSEFSIPRYLENADKILIIPINVFDCQTGSSDGAVNLTDQ